MRALWQSLAAAIARPTDDEDDRSRRRRRGETEGEFARAAIFFSRLSQAKKRTRQFIRAARKRLRYVRTIRLSAEAWGGANAHLRTTLNLFNQIDGDEVAQELDNNGEVCGVSNNRLSPHL